MTKVVSYDGNNINDGSTYVAVISHQPGFSEARYKSVARPGSMPVLGTMLYRDRFIAIQIAVVSSGDPSSAIQNLSKWFDPKSNTSKKLIISDDDDTRPRYIMARTKTMEPLQRGIGRRFWNITLHVDGTDVDGRYRATSGDNDVWNVTADGQTNVLNNQGEDDAFPAFTIKPTSAKGAGFSYGRWIPIRWHYDQMVNIPIDIVDASLDTAALTPAKMQADGDDLRVYNNGQEIERWLGNMDTTTTRVWVDLTFQSKAEHGLKTAMTAVETVTEIEVGFGFSAPRDRDPVQMFRAFPNSGIIMIDSEAFHYDGKLETEAEMKFLNVTRAFRGTTAAAHSAETVIWWVQHDLFIYYGNSSLTAPDQSDNAEPIFNLNTSTNASWVFAEFGRSVVGGSGPGSNSFWQRYDTWDGTSFYGGNRTALAEPWVEAGMTVLAARPVTHIYPFNSGSYRLFHPAGIKTWNITNGEKRWNDGGGSGVWTAQVITQMFGGIDAERGGYIEDTIAQPTVEDTWQSWSSSGTTTQRYGRTLFGFPALGYPTLFSVTLAVQEEVNAPTAVGSLEFADATITFDTVKLPTITVGSEITDIYSVRVTLENQTTGEKIQVNYDLRTNDQIAVDTDAKTVRHTPNGKTKSANRFSALKIVGSARRDWLRLIPGNNTIKFTDREGGTTAVTVTTDWIKRYYD